MLDIENIVDIQSGAKKLEEVVMGLIINSGQACNLAYGTLKIVKQSDLGSVKTVMNQSRPALNEARLVQTKLIEGDQNGGKVKVSLVLAHAQDYLIASVLTRELVTELIELREKLRQWGVYSAATD